MAKTQGTVPERRTLPREKTPESSADDWLVHEEWGTSTQVLGANHPEGLEETLRAHTGQKTVCVPTCESTKILVIHETSMRHLIK